MVRVGASAVADEVAFDSAVLKVDDVESRLARRLGEVDNADAVADRELVLVERRLGAAK